MQRQNKQTLQRQNKQTLQRQRQTNSAETKQTNSAATKTNKLRRDKDKQTLQRENKTNSAATKQTNSAVTKTKQTLQRQNKQTLQRQNKQTLKWQRQNKLCSDKDKTKSAATKQTNTEMTKTKQTLQRQRQNKLWSDKPIKSAIADPRSLRRTVYVITQFCLSYCTFEVMAYVDVIFCTISQWRRILKYIFLVQMLIWIILEENWAMGIILLVWTNEVSQTNSYWVQTDPSAGESDCNKQITIDIRDRCKKCFKWIKSLGKTYKLMFSEIKLWNARFVGIVRALFAIIAHAVEASMIDIIFLPTWLIIFE